MMRSGVLLSVMLLGLIGSAQDAFTTRDQRIDERYTAEDHPKVIELIEVQLHAAPATPWADSVYRYCYKYGRAQWKAHGADAAKLAGNRFMDQVLQIDADATHHVEMLSDLSWLFYELGLMHECIILDSVAMRVADNGRGVTVVRRGRTRQYMGFDLTYIGDHERALRYFLEAVEIYGTTDPVPAIDLSESYNGAGSSSWHLGHLKDAEKYYWKALDLLGDRQDLEAVSARSSTLGNLGILWQDAGDLVKSSSYYQQALALHNERIATEQDPFYRDEAILNRSRTYANLAALNYAMGQYGMSRAFVDLAFADRSGILDADDSKLIALQDLYADIDMAVGDFVKAEQRELTCLASFDRRYGKKSSYYAHSLFKLAELMERRGDFARSDSLYAECIALREGLADRNTDPELARIHLNRSERWIARERWNDALSDLSRARGIFLNILDEDHLKVAQCDVLIGEVYLAMGDVEAADAYAEKALRKIAHRRVADTGVPIPSTFLAPHLLPDAIHLEVMVHRAKAPRGGNGARDKAEIDAAIRALARSRSGMWDDESQLLLLDAQRKIFDLGRMISYEEFIRTGKDIWKNELFRLSEQDRTILLRSRLNGFSSLALAQVPDSVIEREKWLMEQLSVEEEDGDERALALHANQQEYGRFLEELRSRYPAYFELKYGERTFGIGDVQQELLAPGQCMVAFSFTDSVLFAIVVDMDGSAVVRMSATGIPELVLELNEAMTGLDADAYFSSAYRLYERVFAPLLPHLSSTELLIIPDGELHALNFETLLSAPSSANGFRKHLLIQEYTISYLLSATTAIQFKQLDREKGKGTLAIAPGFSDALKEQYLSGVPDPAKVDQAFLKNIQQPFSVSTVEELKRMLSARIMVGADADEHHFKSLAKDFGVIHLGTHTEINNASPLYSRLVLSKGPSDAKDGEDGYLHAYEIYRLELRAELAVLTACETGAGKKYSSEGVRSLAHGFAYAGCPSIVMSLWKIDEKSSADVITRFYDELADGVPKNRALRLAKLAYLEKAADELAMPYYWAGLVLVGDTSMVSTMGNGPSWWWYVLGALIIIALALGVMRLRK